MGWEKRGSQEYFYRKERQGAKVKSTYCGRGQVAHMIAEIQSSPPLLERLARSMKSPQAEEQEKAEAALDQLADLIRLITEAALLAAGFQHIRDSGEKCEMGKQINVNATGNEKYEKLRQLVKSTHKEKPRAEDIEALRRIFDEDPELWRAAGNLSKRTLDHLCRTYYQQSSYVQECVRRRVDEMRQQLGLEEGSALERLLVEQILVCYVNLYVLEMNSAGKLCESHTTEAGLYWDRRLTGAQKRFARACETLARVRRLSLNTPALQFNIAASGGGQQVNFSS